MRNKFKTYCSESRERNNFISISTVHKKAIFAISEACFKSNSEDDFKKIMQDTEGIIGQKMSVCGIAHCRSMTAVLSMNVGFPLAFISKIMASSGDMTLPLFDLWLEKQSPQVWEMDNNISTLPDSDIVLYEKHSVRNFISHCVLDFGQYYASYFGFANMPGKVDAYIIALIKVLVPYLHIAYIQLPSVKKYLVSTLNISPAASSDNRPLLTEKEYHVLSRLLKGDSNRDIAKVMGISKLTVKTHVQRIIKKLNATNRQHAVAIALELKLISL